MKLNHKIFLGLCFALTLFISSCKKWIDVAPKTQVENSRFFSNQQGYVEALNGVYLKMVGTNMYGRELTFGFLDVIGSTYNTSSSNGSVAYRDAFAGSYQNAGPLGIITNIYADSYNAIANLNNIIEQLNNADQSIFAAGKYNEIRGEAIGLRAFIHFDLLRLFTKSYKDGGPNAVGIPYVTQYKPIVTPRLTVKDAMDKIMADLKEAEQLLKAEAIVTEAPTITLGTTFDNRKERFNYYAVKATKARAYLWSLDQANALKEAEEIIAVAPTRFPFIATTAVAAADPNKNRVFTSEHLFGLTAEKLYQNYQAILDTSKFVSSLVITAARKTEQYEGIITDYRLQYLIKDLTATTDPLITAQNRKIFYSKLHQPSTSKRMPLIKIPEMYYIAAECLMNTDPVKAVGYLNTVRTSRGIPNLLSTTSTAAEILTEIQKEYRKEMPMEGQIFYWYKRQNAIALPNVTGAYPVARYVLPLPQQEIDFGN